MATKPHVPGWKPQGGTSRNYINIETGQTLSRRQYDKMRGIFYEAKAAANKAEDLEKALARPARGRLKAQGKPEAEIRAQAYRQKKENEGLLKIQRKADRSKKSVKLKTIRPQLLKSGQRAARIPFATYSDYLKLRDQMLSQKLPNGKRLISWYSLGITGYDERVPDDPRELTATLISIQSPTVLISEDEFNNVVSDFILERTYFVFSHYWLHLHFNNEYAEQRAKRAGKR